MAMVALPDISALGVYAELVPLAKVGQRPYRENAANYRLSGWPGVLPIAYKQKSSPPKGFTGRDNPDPSDEKIINWIKTQGGSNIGLRVPENVIVLDVDVKGDKRGDRVLADLEEQWGKLPATWKIFNREDGRRSGQLVFRLPDHAVGLKWPSAAGPGIDIIQHGHRYCMGPPSMHPDGRVYRWLRPDGVVSVVPPSVDALPYLPDEWIAGLTNGEVYEPPLAGAEGVVAAEWLVEHGAGEPDDRVASAIERATEDLAAEGSCRYDVMVAVVWNLIMDAAEGHPGVAVALNTVHDAYVRAVTEDGTRTPQVAQGEWDRALSEKAFGYAEAKRLQAAAEVSEEEFWVARTVLSHIRTFAHAQRVPPWSVLGDTLIRVVAAIEPHVVLPPIIGGVASLNLFVAKVGDSGSGKDGAFEVSEMAVVVEPKTDMFKPGSGEGLAHAFMKRLPAKLGGNVVQFRTRAVYRSSEIDSLTAIAQRSASTLDSELRLAWFGQTVGFQNADPAKTVQAPAHSYRFCMTFGVQPRRAQALFDQADGGTPQRVLWLAGTDPDIPDERPPRPEPIHWSPPEEVRLTTERIEIKVCNTAWEAIDQAALDRARGVAHALDGHLLLCREKVAAALALLDGRLNITDEDWLLAGCVIEHSNAVRAATLAELRRADDERVRAGGRRDALRTASSTDYSAELEEKNVKRVAKNLLSKISKDWVTDRPLKNKIAARDRVLFEAAMELLVETEKIERTAVRGQGQSGHQSRRRK